VNFLLDQNLSPRLCRDLKDVWSLVHVREVGLAAAEDMAVWAYARENGLTILTKDSDFNSLAFLFGAPPKVVWIQLGNCSTSDIAALLRRSRVDLQVFEADSESALLTLA
jgi:predicted nuclease of predicted toxin-antitoxin system